MRFENCAADNVFPESVIVPPNMVLVLEVLSKPDTVEELEPLIASVFPIRRDPPMKLRVLPPSGEPPVGMVGFTDVPVFVKEVLPVLCKMNG